MKSQREGKRGHENKSGARGRGEKARQVAEAKLNMGLCVMMKMLDLPKNNSKPLKGMHSISNVTSIKINP